MVHTNLAGFARILGNQGRKASHESFVIKFDHPVEIVKRYAAFLVERVHLVYSIFFNLSTRSMVLEQVKNK